jgi:hypothetical protein
VRRRGLSDTIANQLGRLEPAAERIRSDILANEEGQFQLFEDGSPIWLRLAFMQLPVLPRQQLPSWLAVDDLPPLVVGSRCLNPGQVKTVLRALQGTKRDAEAPQLLAALRRHVAGGRREAFAWRLMEQWQGVGGPALDTLALVAVGWLGEDDSVLRLAGLIRDCSASSRRAQASVALECLRALGSPLALVQLANLSRQLKVRQLRDRARELLEEAARRGLSVEALKDRAVPALGFEGCAGPVFDFGPRRFQAILAPGPRLALRDEAGQLRANLPAPGARDDRDKVGKATADWRALKQQLREVVKEQTHRLESAMISGQRWPATWFTSHILAHPVLALLARLVLWGGYDERGRLALPFRVNEEQEPVDADESPVALTDLTSVRVVHPIELSEAARARWLQTWSDHELIPPFAQLGRRLFHLTPEQESATAITWFSGHCIPALTLSSLVKAGDWQPVLLGDQARRGEAHRKVFARRNLTAILHHPGVSQRRYPDPLAEQDLACAFFLRGLVRADDGIDRSRALPLGQVDALTRSAVCELLVLLWSKGKE